MTAHLPSASSGVKRVTDGRSPLQEFVNPRWIVSRIRDRVKDTPAPRCPNCEKHLRTEVDHDSNRQVKVRDPCSNFSGRCHELRRL